MTHVGHLFDGSAGWEQRVGVSQLLDRLPSDRYQSTLAALGADARAPLVSLRRPLRTFAAPPGLDVFSAPAVAGFLRRHGIDLVHAWGSRAAGTSAAASAVPLVVQIFDPLAATRDVKRLRCLARPEGFAIACASEIVRRRLVEGGLDARLAVVIRPGVDFQQINRWRRSDIRESLGLSRDEYVVIVPAPVTRTGGQADAASAVALGSMLSDGLHVLLPDRSTDARRIERRIATLPDTRSLVTATTGHSFEQLLAVSDALLITPRGDFSTTSIAWAMAAGVAVIGTAVYSVAEMISHKVNGLLFKQTPGRSMTPAILACLGQRDAQKKAIEVARGHAYEAFGLRRYVEQYMQLYENVLSGADPGAGITDSAIVQ